MPGGGGFVISPIGIQPIIIEPIDPICLRTEKDDSPTGTKGGFDVATVCDGSAFCVQDALPAEPAAGTTRLLIRGSLMGGVNLVTVWAPGTDIPPATYVPSQVSSTQVVVAGVHLRATGGLPTIATKAASSTYSIKLEKAAQYCEAPVTLNGYAVRGPSLSSFADVIKTDVASTERTIPGSGFGNVDTVCPPNVASCHICPTALP